MFSAIETIINLLGRIETNFLVFFRKKFILEKKICYSKLTKKARSFKKTSKPQLKVKKLIIYKNLGKEDFHYNESGLLEAKTVEDTCK